MSDDKKLDRDALMKRINTLLEDLPEDHLGNLIDQLEYQSNALYESGKDRRKYPRTHFNKEVDYSAKDQFHRDMANDISPGGLMFETRKPFEVGERLTLIIQIKENERPLRIPGEVVRTSDQIIGIRFDVNRHVEASLEYFIERI
jgi:PilZ domain-containing protein